MRAAVALGLCAVVPAPTLFGALASAAGTILEAAPFVVGPALAPRLRFARYLPSLACGCGGALPAALSLPSLALTWLAFGPAVTLLRAAAAICVLLVARHFRRLRSDEDDSHVDRMDPLRELGAIGASSFAAALVVEFMRAHALSTTAVPAALRLSLSFASGALAGAMMPCGTAGVGAAAAFRFTGAGTAFGLLATAGLLSLRARRVSAPLRRRLVMECVSARFTYASLAGACACFVVWGTHGFLNPRFSPLIVLGAACCAVAALRGLQTSTRASPLVPAALLLALIAGSPPPNQALATIPVGLYPGEAFAFTGRAAATRDPQAPTTLLRAAILCCRADAQMLAVTLDRHVAAPANAWISARGVVSLQGGQFVLRATSVAAAPAPLDPYLYL